MAIVPTFQREDLPQAMQTGAQMDIGSAGIVGQALERFGQAGVDSAVSMLHAENYDWTAKNTSSFALDRAQALDAAKQQAAQTGDYKGAITKFNADTTAAQAAIIAQAPSQRAADAFTLNSKGTMLDLTRDANTFAQRGEGSVQKSNIQANLDNLSASSLRNPALADTNYGTGLGIIAGAQKSGIAGPDVDWQSMKDNWGRQNYSAVVRHQIDQDPNGALAALNGGKYDFALHSEDVENLSRQAQVQIDRRQQQALMAEQRQYTMEARQEAAAARQLRQAQAGNEANMLADAVGGKPIDTDKLVDMVRSQQITPAGMDAIMRGQEGRDDPATMLHLYSQLGSGQLQAGDIMTAVANHQIKASTGVELQRGLNEREKSGDNQVERGAFDTLKTALGGAAAEQGIDLFGQGKAQAAQLWTQAQGEWNQRVIINHQDPQATLADMIPRYSPKASVPTWLPAPQMGAVTAPEQVPLIWGQTKQALAAGTITHSQYDAQAALLMQYQKFFVSKAQRDAAIAAVRGAKPSTPGAAVAPSPPLVPANTDGP
jgi:hypothetical protein